MKAGNLIGNDKNRLYGEFLENGDIPASSGFSAILTYGGLSNIEGANNIIELTESNVPLLVFLYDQKGSSKLGVGFFNNTDKNIVVEYIINTLTGGNCTKEEITINPQDNGYVYPKVTFVGNLKNVTFPIICRFE